MLSLIKKSLAALDKKGPGCLDKREPCRPKDQGGQPMALRHKYTIVEHTQWNSGG